MISVIVPYHNSSAFLDDCIESIINQTYENWELILVNDHSTDMSQSISSKYARINKKIVLVDCVGYGVSAARNTGIENAKGNYIVFVDSDDWIEKNALEIFANSINEAELVSASYCKKENVNDFEEKKYCLKNECMNRSEFVVKLFNSKEVYQGYCWGKIFRSEIIKDNNIRFDTLLAYNEDRLFVLEYAMHSNKVMEINEVLYCYRQHSGSAMSRAEVDDKVVAMKLHNEIQSAKKMDTYLSADFPDGEAWLEYNLLKKLYFYQKKFRSSREIQKEIKAEVSRLEKKMRNNKYIDKISKIKLLWKKMK